MNELDEAAWERWVAFRKAIRKPIKPASESAMKLKLSRFGADQDAVVNQSIANQWQGLFDLKDNKKKPDRPQKSPEQKAADDEMFKAAQDRAAKGWEKLEPTPLNRLKLCDALWARYTVTEDADTAERIEWLKGVIAMHLREANPRDVLGDPHLTTMVFALFGPRGLNRLRERAQ